jgi:nucleoside diphosphate kinase
VTPKDAKEALASASLDELKAAMTDLDAESVAKLKAALQPPAAEKLFIINGFYMAMREKFTLESAQIHYFVVEFDAEKLSWEDFRGKVLGATDPSKAAEGSIRSLILTKYSELGLASAPTTGDNGVHASASPFEGMCEFLNWLEVPLDEDPFAQALLAAGMSKDLLMEWTKDPQVEVAGKKASIFDQLEDMNAADCLAKACEIAEAKGDQAKLTTNRAFVFVKPHAVTDAAVALVKATFEEKGVSVLKDGVLPGPTIGEKKLIDNHYYAIANKASLTAPKDLNPPEAKVAEFKEKFGVSWPDALADGKVLNAMEGCAKWGLSGKEMERKWRVSEKAGQFLKFGGGFYAGLVDPAA